MLRRCRIGRGRRFGAVADDTFDRIHILLEPHTHRPGRTCICSIEPAGAAWHIRALLLSLARSRRRGGGGTPPTRRRSRIPNRCCSEGWRSRRGGALRGTCSTTRGVQGVPPGYRRPLLFVSARASRWATYSARATESASRGPRCFRRSLFVILIARFTTPIAGASPAGAVAHAVRSQAGWEGFTRAFVPRKEP
jgi:hypothetical protein